MRVVVQRASQASVRINDEVVGSIGTGLLLLVAMHGQETEEDLAWMANRCVGLRVFEDPEGKMNLSLKDVGGSLLVVSQFTLYGDCSKGRRPSFIKAGDPEISAELIDRFVELLRAEDVDVATGRFGAMMKVELANEGPVTLIIER